MRFNQKEDSGVAGLTILLSVIVMLFSIGLLVMIFALMGTGLQDASYDELTSVSVVNESITFSVLNANITLDGGSARDGVCGTITEVWNGTATNEFGVVATAGVGNITQIGCNLINATALSTFCETGSCYASYPYTWSADNEATDVMNETTFAIANVTDWFAIFIVITAMLVLILLTVIIITAIRGSGMMGGGDSTGTG